MDQASVLKMPLRAGFKDHFSFTPAKQTIASIMGKQPGDMLSERAPKRRAWATSRIGFQDGQYIQQQA